MSDSFSAESWPPEDPDDLLAAEYVLGVLEHDDRQRAAERAEIDGAFRARIAAWERRLAVLNTAFDDGPVNPAVLPAIEVALFDRPAAPRRRLGWLWAAGTLVAAVFALAVMLWPVPEPQRLMARLDAGDLVFEASYQDALLQIARIGPGPDEGHDYELWAIGADGVPVSLGLLRGDLQQVAVDLDAGMTLAVSLEPLGGAPGAVATGPVLAAAPLTRL